VHGLVTERRDVGKRKERRDGIEGERREMSAAVENRIICRKDNAKGQYNV